MSVTTINIATNKASSSVVALTPLAAIHGLHHLSVGSKWSNVKAPDELRNQLGLSLDISDLRTLHQWLGTYLELNA